MKSNHLRNISFVFCFFVLLAGCAQNKMEPIQDNYEYSQKSIYYLEPDISAGAVKKTALTTSTDDGNFYAFSEDESVANEFVNAQRTLVAYLRSQGAHIDEMTYYGMDYGYSFSKSSKSSAYVSLSDIRSWQQVLVTLQTVWGDYTDYGYLFALSNAIAEELEWKTDDIPAYNNNETDLFFVENPAVVNLLYPTFTTEFASLETVNNSKALACFLLEDINWMRALNKPISDQLDDYYQLITSYAQRLSIPFARQTCGYASYGEKIKLRIMTTYLEIVIDGNFHDVRESTYGDCWNDYLSIYKTVNLIDNETSTAVEFFDLQNTVKVMQLKFIDSNHEWEDMHLPGNHGGMYVGETAYVNSLFHYLHEYYHHLECELTGKSEHSWQSQAFCEIGASHSQYRPEGMGKILSEAGNGTDLFYMCTGRAYQTERNDYYEAFDILCFAEDYYELQYTRAESLNSFSRYLMDIYGEKTVCELMLYPDTVEEVTGETWVQLALKWEQHIREKYDGVKIPFIE